MNATEVTTKELSKNLHGDEFDVVILSAPTVDITNLDTSNLNPSDNTDVFKQEVIISCKNMMTVAQDAIKQKSGLKKIILLCLHPRFDKHEVDPLSFKQALAKFANSTLHQLWKDSP